MPRPALLVLCALTLILAACAEDERRVLIDLEGPRGTVTAPGPWGVAVLTDGTRPRLYVALEPAPFAEAPLEAIGGGQFTGVLPPAPIGAVVAYYATAADEAIPPGAAEAPRRVTVVPRALPETDAGPPATCRLAFRRPRAGDRLAEATDDNAPQAGLQLTVQLDTDLPPEHAVRLLVDDTGYAGRTGQGLAAFDAVTLPPGVLTLTADAVPPGGGEPCVATITVTVDPP